MTKETLFIEVAHASIRQGFYLNKLPYYRQ